MIRYPEEKKPYTKQVSEKLAVVRQKAGVLFLRAKNKILNWMLGKDSWLPLRVTGTKGVI